MATDDRVVAVPPPLLERMARQDREYGAFGNEVDDVRLAIAVLQDEVNETLNAWRIDRASDDRLWNHVYDELEDVAAIALRALAAIEPLVTSDVSSKNVDSVP